MGPPERLVSMGRIGGAYGVRGWVRVTSDTVPPERLLDYRPWHFRLHDRELAARVTDAKTHGKGLVLKLEGCDDRAQAARYAGASILVPRSALPAPAPGEYYWSDLVGMAVVDVQGVALGAVDHLLETGANDVLVVRGERERLIPFVSPEVVREVDVERRRIVVDWDRED